MNTEKDNKSILSQQQYFFLIFILGFISMLMPLSIDMYLPSMPTIASDFQVSDGEVQLTISNYLIGFSLGQLLYGPLSDSFGRKPIILFGLILFLVAAAGCALSQTITQLITIRLFHGLAAAACAVVVNALLRDLFDKEDFSRVMSFVTLVMTVAPLLAPILGGFLLIWFNWHAIFWSLCLSALFVFILVCFFIPETLSKERRSKFSLHTVLYNFIMLFRHKKIFCYMIVGAFSGAGLFSFLSFGSFVYMGIYGVAAEHFGYYFAINIFALIIMTSINSRFVKRYGSATMLTIGLVVQGVMALWLVIVTAFNLGFIPLVVGCAGYMGCLSMIGSNVMAVILSDYPHMAGTVSSLAGTLRFLIASLVVSALSGVLDKKRVEQVSVYLSEWLMVGSMVFCVLLAILFFMLAKRAAKKEISKNDKMATIN